VQGVFFRANIEELASKLGITGWVMNTNEGVEVVAEGDEQALKQLIDYCNHGPSAAHVDDIEIKHEKATGEFSSFEIRY